MSFCKTCKIELTEFNCYKRTNGKLRSYCKICHNKKSDEYKLSPHNLNKIKKVNSLRSKRNRKDPAKLASVILKDSKSNDRKHKRENDLTIEFVTNIIKNVCTYCGENSLRISLDRIDNSLGHLQTNVVPACIRCNLIRGNMPYQAWLCLIPGIKDAISKRLFGDWFGKFIKKSEIDV